MAGDGDWGGRERGRNWPKQHDGFAARELRARYGVPHMVSSGKSPYDGGDYDLAKMGIGRYFYDFLASLE